MGEAKQFSEAEAARFLEKGGLWQWEQLILVSFSLISGAVQSMSIIFIGFTPKFACSDNLEQSKNWNRTNGDIFNSSCAMGDNSTDQCQTGFYYNVKGEESIVSEWDLICDKAYLAEVSQLLYVVGKGVGALIIGPASDRLGRKKSFLSARVLSLCFSTGLIFSSGVEVFVILRFLLGLSEMSCSLVRTVYITELTPIKYRPLATSLSGITWALALCVEALIGHVLRGWNWRIVQAIITVFTLSVFLEVIFLKESVNWLFANGKVKEAAVILKPAFKKNGSMCPSSKLEHSHKHVENRGVDKPVLENDRSPNEVRVATPKENKIKLENSHKYVENRGVDKPVLGNDRSPNEVSIATPKENKITLIDMLKNRTSRCLVLVNCFVWFVSGLIYYSLSLMSLAMVGDRVLNFFILSVVELPAHCGVFFMLRSFGRKIPMIGCHVLCAICLLLAGVFSFAMDGATKNVGIQIVTFIGKFGISVSFQMLYFYTTESLPTNFRTTGLGIAAFSARCGSCLSPFSSVLLTLLPWGPGIIFGCLCLIVSGLLFLVPETGHQKLPTTISEIDSWKKCKK